MNAPAEVELACWLADGHPLTIEYDPVTLNTIRCEAIDGLNRLSRGGLEIGGVLFGRKDGDRITILSHCPVACEYALGPTFTLSANDERALESLLAAPAREGIEAVGWYHSHTRSEITLSAKDVQFFDRYFPEPWQIALVVKPHRFDPARAGFFFREPEGRIHAESTYREFLLKPLNQERVQATAPAAPPVKTRPVTMPPVVTPIIPSRAPLRAESAPKVTRRRWPFAAALVAAAALTGTISFLYSNSLHQPAVNLALRVFDTGGQLRIDWDREAAPVRDAESAIIEINDGGTKRNEALDAAQLRAGSVTYLRSSGDVAVRLRILSADRRVIDEGTRFIGPPVQMASAGNAGSADREAEEVTIAPPLKKPAPAPVRAPAAPLLGDLANPKPLDPPSAGDVVWTGKLSAPATLRIRSGHATSGSIAGHLPGQPVKLTVAPEPDGQVQIAEPPGPQNAWQNVALSVMSGEPKKIVLHWELAASN